MDDILWWEPVQIVRRPQTARQEGWDQAGRVLPLSAAIREALILLQRESVSIRHVRPHAGQKPLREADILKLMRRADYPFRDSPISSCREVHP